MSNLKLAKRYALALFNLTIEQGKTKLDNTKQELSIIYETIFKNNEFREFFTHPIVSYDKKEDVIKASLENKISCNTYNFLLMIIKENRFEIFDEIYDCYNKLFNKHNNKKEIEVISAIELDSEEKEKIKSKLKDKLNFDIILKNSTDKEILGGIIIKFNDTIIDLSLKKRFENLIRI